MAAKRYRWLKVMAVAVCLAVQGFIIVPHHHHAGNEAPCLNVVHCISHAVSHTKAEPAGCGHDHCTPEQAPVPDHECGFHVDTPQPVNMRQSSALFDVLAVFNDLYAPEAIIAPEQSHTEPCLTLTRRRQSSVVQDICVAYLAEAHSARAPSHLV